MGLTKHQMIECKAEKEHLEAAQHEKSVLYYLEFDKEKREITIVLPTEANGKLTLSEEWVRDLITQLECLIQ